MDNNNTKMEHRINLEKQNKSNDQVKELNLDNCRAPQITGLTDEFVNLETLSMINVGLTTLKGFPKLPKLRKLELSDNRITGGLNLLHGSPKLQHLNLSGNRIKDFDALEPLKEFHDLVNLDLFNCEVTKSEGYRQKVFQMLPSLRSLDGFDQNEKEVKSDDEEDEESEEDEEIENGQGGKVGEGALDDEYDDDDDDEEADDDADDDDEDDEDDDDDDDEEYDEEEYNGTERVGSIQEGDAEDSDDDSNEDDDEELDSEPDASLNQLEKDDIQDESDDDDFEPTGDPDPRDHEIDEEDLAEEDDEDIAGANASVAEESSKQTERGMKRKHEEEAGDEAGDD